MKPEAPRRAAQRSRKAPDSEPIPAPASKSLAVCRVEGENKDAIKRATVAGVINCPSSDLRFWLILRPISLRIVSTCSNVWSIFVPYGQNLSKRRIGHGVCALIHQGEAAHMGQHVRAVDKKIPTSSLEKLEFIM